MSGEQHAPGPNSASGRIRVAECDYDVETGDIEFMFRDADKSTLKYNIGQFPERIVRQAALRGIMESVRDTYAGSKGDVAAAKASAQSRLDLLLSGEWSKGREGTGEGQGAIWVEAVARIRSWDVATARQKLFADAVTDEQRKQIKASAQVQKVVAEIRLERAQAAVKAAGEAAESGASVLDGLS